MEKRLTTTSTITSKYQTVIPRQVRQDMELKMNQEIIWRTVTLGNQKVSIVSSKPKRWSEYTRGLGKDIWKGVDSDEYLQSLRDEWGK